jgi:beta,beta-carotene 9',10'-dioxygenase
MGEQAHYALGFATLDREVSKIPLAVEGTLPAWLGGSLIRTGPAKFEVGQQNYQHWFDGLAMLHCFDLRSGGVTYSNRFLRSEAYCEAMAQSRIARGEFMTDPCRTLFGRVMSLFNPQAHRQCLDKRLDAGMPVGRAPGNPAPGPL